MGSPLTEANRFTNEGPVHTVTLSPFLIAKFAVTQTEYELVMGTNPSFQTGNGQRPVERVSWDDLKDPDGFLERTGLSLPSEAQWEYAARGGTETAFSFGDECNANTCAACAPANDHMWWCASAGNTTHPVGEKLPNPFGLHDMHGNVYVWCEDVYDPGFYAKPEALLLNPVSSAGSEIRVIRGGFFDSVATDCRSAYRNAVIPSGHVSALGFRPARPLP
jgi:formylglycine-generating enzyme required for sulfatase activity